MASFKTCDCGGGYRIREFFMIEWEKLQVGLVHNDFDEDLFKRRVVAKRLFRAYNKTEDEDTILNKTVQTSWQKCVD